MKADELRELIKEEELESGNNRIKVTKTLCQGACRYSQVAVIYADTTLDENLKNNNIWLKHTHKYSLKKWKELLEKLKDNKSLDDFEQIKMRVF